MTADALRDVSAAIIGRLLPVILEDVEAGGVIGLYAAMSAEVDLDPAVSPLTEAGHPVAFPRVSAGGRMAFHQVGRTADLVRRRPAPSLPAIREPTVDAPVVTPGVVVVPGLAFDGTGGRLGHGGGYYDRYLADHPAPRTIGVCASALLVDRVPVEPHDRRVDAVVTEHDVYRC